MTAESLTAMRRYFDSGATRLFPFRREQLNKLSQAIRKYENELYHALHTDLGRSAEESWITEIGIVLHEINYMRRHLQQWMRPEKVKTNLVNFPSSSYVMHEPLGVVLIIAPWNYPFQLLLNPLAGAIAAGNCAVLKPSEYAPSVSAVIKKIIEENFPPQYILYVEGDGAAIVPDMMHQFRFDHVFFTGSTQTGKKIYQMAAEKLVPVTLELGGKTPCVVEKDARLNVAVRRIVQAKFANAGQMCVAPDYVLVHEDIKEKLLQAMKQTIQKFFSEDPSASYSYCHIIHEKHFDRLIGFLKDGNIAHGGKFDKSRLYIEPTLLMHVAPDAPVMKEEIFGPVLPVLSFRTFDEAKAIIRRNPDPLAFYVFTSSRQKEKQWLEEIPAGGACINNASWHFTNPCLPFGGRGNSGIGHYHGRHSFDTFSHRKAILKTPVWFDPAIKYPPYNGKLGLFKRVM